MKKILISLGSAVVFLIPGLILAQPKLDGYLGTLTGQATNLLGKFVTFLVSLAVVWFIWNVIRYTISADEDKKSAAKGQMVWGIVAIAVIVSIWGLVAIFRTAFGVENGAIPGSVNSMIPGVSNGSSLPRIPDGTEWQDYANLPNR